MGEPPPTLDPDELSAEEIRRVRRAHPLVNRAIWADWGCVVLSAIFLWLSGPMTQSSDSGHAVMWAVYLMLARFFGICSFAIGGLAIFNHRWWVGVTLFLLSVLLPFLAYTMHGTI